MPKYEDEEIARIYRRRQVKTFGDKVKEVLGAIGGMIFMISIIVMIFSG